MYIHCTNNSIFGSGPLPPGVAAGEGDFVKLASDDFDALVMQDARVFTAGNSLAIRIPSAIAKHIAFEDRAAAVRCW